jgi:BirA family biotin operon repressor/biotin-[acetyl-CoA-carboxylase] ligase
MKAFDAAAFQAERRGRFGADLRCLAEAVSTQDEMRQAADDGAQEGSVVLAESQAAGRGRWGKSWQGKQGQSLLFTVLLNPQGRPTGTLPLVLGLVTAEALRALGLSSASVKWPNDLWAQDRKLGGFLLETHGPLIVAGCGLNVAQSAPDFSPELQASASSLYQEGLKLSRETLLAALLEAWQNGVEVWKDAGFGPFLNRFEAVDALSGRSCSLRSGGRAFQGRYLGVDLAGALRLGLEHGQESLFQSAEIELLRPGGLD